jgi:hypothetical protein
MNINTVYGISHYVMTICELILVQERMLWVLWEEKNCLMITVFVWVWMVDVLPPPVPLK